MSRIKGNQQAMVNHPTAGNVRELSLIDLEEQGEKVITRTQGEQLQLWERTPFSGEKCNQLGAWGNEFPKLILLSPPISHY